MKKFLPFLVFVSFLVFMGGTFSPRDAGAEEGGYVGSEICKGCHEDHYKTYMMSTHAKKGVPGSPAKQYECESCHGPGAAHVEKSGEGGVGIFIFGKRIEDARAKSAKCLECHADFPELSFWDQGRHKERGVSCDNCHTVHSGARKNLKAPQPELCNVCHPRVRADQNRQSHHPIREGRIQCTSCHEHHGSFSDKQVKGDVTRELCLRCHAEKRGPYMWPHPPVEEDCLGCHVPHGSNHTKLMNSRMPQVCRNCHDDTRHPSTVYTRFETFQGATPTNRMFARSCLNCHQNIHGSNGPSVRGERFVR